MMLLKLLPGLLLILVLNTMTLSQTREGLVQKVYGDTLRTVNTYGHNSILISSSNQKMINGCWRETEYRQYDQEGNLIGDRLTRYEISTQNTCDFTPYIEWNRVYKKKKLYREFGQQAACDACEASPCGIEKRWNPSGKVSYQRRHRKCSFEAVISQ